MGGQQEGIRGAHGDQQGQSTPVHAGQFSQGHHQGNQQHGGGDVGHEQREQGREHRHRRQQHQGMAALQPEHQVIGQECRRACAFHGQPQGNQTGQQKDCAPLYRPVGLVDGDHPTQNHDQSAGDQGQGQRNPGQGQGDCSQKADQGQPRPDRHCRFGLNG